MATDRLSAFDVVLPTPIPDKGRVLTQLSLFWFEKLRDVVPNHVFRAPPSFPAALAPFAEQLAGRSMLCRKTKPVPIECVVRGYLVGLGLEGLQGDGKSLRHRAAAGLAGIGAAARADFHALHQGDRGPRRKYHLRRGGRAHRRARCAEQLRAISLEIYRRAAAYAEPRGILLADTKFEFGLDRR